MKYSIDYTIYMVSIEENIGIYDYFNANYGRQFPVRVLDGDKRSDGTGWRIIFADDILGECKARCKEEIVLEHNLSGRYCNGEGYRLYMSLNEDWCIKLTPDDTMVIQATNKATAIFITKKVLKQISRCEHNRYRNVLIHASSIVHGNLGYAFMGQKGAGKTTVMMNALVGEARFSFLSNDIVAIDKQERLLGIYSSVGIGHLTVEYLSKNVGMAFPVFEEPKKYLELGVFCDIFDISCIDKAALKAIFVLVDSDSESFTVEKCAQSLSKELILSNVLLSGKDIELSDHPDWMCLMEYIPEESVLPVYCEYLSRKVDCFAVRYNMSRKEDFIQLYNAILEMH